MARWVDVRLVQADYSRALDVLIGALGAVSLKLDTDPPSSAPRTTEHDTEVELSVESDAATETRVAGLLAEAGIPVLAIRTRLGESLADEMGRAQ